MRAERVCAVVVMAVFLAVFQGGCIRRSGPSKNGRVTVGFSMDTLQQERWYTDRADFTADVKSLGANIIVDVANDNDAEQLSQVKEMLKTGINVLVIIPHDAKAAASAVALAKKSGVKVISYDRLVLGADVDLYISFDNVRVGEEQASAMLSAVPSGNYVIMRGPAGDYNTVMIAQGIYKTLAPYIKSGRINIVKEFSTEDWMADEAESDMQKLLQNGTKIDGVIAENDSLAGGVIDKLSEYQMIPRVPVDGMDADLSACQRVVEGQQLMTVYKPINKLAKTAANFAVELAKGEKINVPGKISDGKYNVPYYTIPPEEVSKDNMVSTVIKDGFHKINEVYMNVPQSQWPQ